MGMLIERRKDLRGLTQMESGLKWAKAAFGDMLRDKKGMFVVPKEMKLGSDPQWLKEKAIFSREELPRISRLLDRGCEPVKAI